MPSKRGRIERVRDRTQNIQRRRWLQTLGIAGVTGLAGCSTDETTDTEEPTDTDVGFGTDTVEPTPTPEELPEVGGTYTNAISSDVSTLNPIYNTENTAGGLITNTTDGAYTFRPGQRLFPLLANMKSDDKQVWTVSIRENLEWSDPYGQVTAEDWVYYIKNVHKSDWSGSNRQADWTEDYTVEKNDKYSFTIELSNINPIFHKERPMWGHQVVPKELIKPYVDEEDVEGMKKDEELLNLDYTGNLGAYNLEAWERENRFVFTRNEDYYMRDLAEEDDEIPDAFAKAPYFDRLVTEIIDESSSRLSALKTGEIDTASVPPNKASQFKGDANEDVYLNVTPQPYNVPLAYNMRANGWTPFRNKKVRQGLGCAVDKKRLVKGVYRGHATPQYTWQPQWSPWYDDSQVTKFGTGDLYGSEATRSRLEEGLSGTDYGYSGETLVDGDGEQVELSLYHSAGQPTERQTAEFVAQEFADNAGIKVNVESIPGQQFDANYWQQEEPENPDELEWSRPYPTNYGPRDEVTGKNPWDMSLVYGLNTFPMTPTTNSLFFGEKAYYNPYGYVPSDDASNLMDLFDEASKETDDAKRKETLAEIFGILSREQPTGMLVLNSDIFGYQSGIRGPVEDFFSGWDSATWYREE